MVQTKLLLFLFLFIPLISEATDLKPWFRNDIETGIRATVLYQNYNFLAISRPHCGCSKRNENDVFTTLSGTYPFKRYCGEFEATAAYTRHKRFSWGWDNFRVTGRYQWFNESEGDSFSLVTGLTLSAPYSRALNDISSFHHGHVEGEVTASFGNEYGCQQCSKEYIFRWWNVVGIGVAEKGSPWVREDVACEYNYDDVHKFRGFINTLWGMGKDNLQPNFFHGYGNIKHKSVDVGIRYGYRIGCWGTFSVQYARRVFAYNFPKNVNLTVLEYYYPFGHQSPCSY